MCCFDLRPQWILCTLCYWPEDDPLSNSKINLCTTFYYSNLKSYMFQPYETSIIRQWWWLSRTIETCSVLDYYNEMVYIDCKFCWPCILSQILLIINSMHFSMYLFISSLYMFRSSVFVIRRSNCINTSSGMISLCDCLVCRSGPAYQAVTYTD